MPALCRGLPEGLAKIADIAGPAKDIEIAVLCAAAGGPRPRMIFPQVRAPDRICVELLKQVVAWATHHFSPFAAPGHGTADLRAHSEAAARIAKSAMWQYQLNVGGGFPANYVLARRPSLKCFSGPSRKPC
jgi:hypothetical protein